MLVLLSGVHLSRAQDLTPDQYLQRVSLFTPFAACSPGIAIQTGIKCPLSPPSTYNSFPYMPHEPLKVPVGTKVMVFVPHPDDEAIAASGLIQRVVSQEGNVRLVFLTNGDGYVQAVRLLANKQQVYPKDFVEYGKKRQEEGVQAACELGLQPEDLVFMGFPDDGIDDLWESYWSNAKSFISPYTLFDRPHRKGMNHWVKYSGQELSQEIERLILEFSPDWVVLPDPRDLHADHATTGVFVLDALREMYLDGKGTYPAQVLTYLVHFRDYPHAGQWAKEICASGVSGCPVSGSTLSNSGWVSLSLTPEEVEGKRRALLAHATQQQLLQYFFKNFLLPGEMFASLNIMQVITVPQEYAAYFRHPPEPIEPELPE